MVVPWVSVVTPVGECLVYGRSHRGDEGRLFGSVRLALAFVFRSMVCRCLSRGTGLLGRRRIEIVEMGALRTADRSERVCHLLHNGLRGAAWYPWLLVWIDISC